MVNLIRNIWSKWTLIQKICFSTITIILIILIISIFILSYGKINQNLHQQIIIQEIRYFEKLNWEDDIIVDIKWPIKRIFKKNNIPDKIIINIPKLRSEIITDYNTNRFYIECLLSRFGGLNKNNIEITNNRDYTNDDINHLIYIEQTLKIVSENWFNTDINGDGKINCIDAAILFYKYYPNNDVRIIININKKTEFYHLFNAVFINGIWQEIEPQAFESLFTIQSYKLNEVWGDLYDCSLNFDVTKEFSMYAFPLPRNEKKNINFPENN